LRAFEKNRNTLANAEAPINPVRRLPEKANPGNAPGCERYVPTQDCFGKARERSFRGFITVETRYSAPIRPATALLPETTQKPSFPAKELLRETPWTSP
jgi:hypothetical protein